MHKHTGFVLTLAALACLAALAGVTTAQKQGAAAAAIGVIDVAKVYNTLAEKTEIDAALETMRRNIEKQNTERSEKIKALQDDLRELTQPGTDAYNKKRDELQLKALELQAWREFQKKRLGAEQALRKEQLYKKILDAVAAYAQANEYDLVLYREAEVNFRNATSGQVDALIALRKVIWSKDGMDITDAVVARMNNEFNNAVE